MTKQTKRGRGRPPGPVLSPADLLHPRSVRLTDAEWASCLSTGDASGFVRKAIQKAIQKALRQTLTGQSQGKPAGRGEGQRLR